MLLYQISVFIENKPGRLAEMIDLLAENGVDIRALSVADTADFGILRLIVNDPELATRTLQEQGVTVTKTQVIGVKLSDTTGALSKVLALLAKAQIAVEYAYAFITHSRNEACVVLRVEDNERAISTLRENGVALVEAID